MKSRSLGFCAREIIARQELIALRGHRGFGGVTRVRASLRAARNHGGALETMSLYGVVGSDLRVRRAVDLLGSSSRVGDNDAPAILPSRDISGSPSSTTTVLYAVSRPMRTRGNT